MPLFYAFHHPIYQDIEFFDLLNTVSYPDEVKKMLFENTTFTSSNLEHNHQGGDFLLELIFKKAEECLNVDTEDVYHDTDLYHKIVSWRALLRSS